VRHNRQTKRFGRTFSERKALLESLVTSLLKYQQIKTTVQKAKAAKRLADRVIHLGKQDSLAARRQVFSYLQDNALTSKLFKEVSPRFKDRKGGYTRILHLGRRKGDGAELALLELTEKEIKLRPTKKSKKASLEHKGHAHEHAEEPHKPQAHPQEKETHAAHPKEKPEKPKTGFFRNLGKFFRNKGGS
jgi:large subunit ribosomal protein L17